MMKLPILMHLFAAMMCLSLLACTGPVEKIQPVTELNDNWQIQSSAEISVAGDQLSLPDHPIQNWYRGNIPATVMSILRQNKDFGNLFMGKNIEEIDTKQFEVPWWYRKTFEIENVDDKAVYRLYFEGLNYKANVWVNGKLIADAKTIEGAFGMWDLNISEAVQEGTNAVAIEIIPPLKGDLTIGFVDWNPKAPDQNMGLWRGVKLIKTGAVSLQSPFVVSDVDTETLKNAKLTISSRVKNHSQEEQNVTVQANIEGIGIVEQMVVLAAGQERDVVFEAHNYPVLNVQNPKLWWPVNLGNPDLYTISMTVINEGKSSDQADSRFGIREVEEYLTKDGHKGWKVNGKKITIKGGGWVDDMMLADSDDKVISQVEYTRHMNLNCIRLEGFWGRNKTLYEACDENGILLMIGWSCHWEWESYCGRPDTHFLGITGEEEIERHAQSYRDQVLYLRNHPSVFLWVFGSDKLPLPGLERKLNTCIKAVDNSRPILASCKYQDFGTDHYNNSEVSGPTGVKMLGPYGYVPPVYWYIDTIAGGAYGFNTETGPGPQVPPMESIRKMIPEDSLWPIDEVWDFHCNRHQFGSLDRYLRAFNGRYGKAKDVEEFAFKSQISNYEAIRPMFEAFQVNKTNSTGVIQWMLNSAWPAMFWQLYDYYMLPNGAFYGTKKACQPINAVYNYKDNNIYLVNDYNHDVEYLKIKVSVLDIQSKVLFSKEKIVTAKEISSAKVIEIPELKGLSKTYFIDLRIEDKAAKEVANNFYWLSTKDDVMEFEKTTWVYTPTKSFADLKGINTMPQVDIEKKYNRVEDGNYVHFSCQLTNPADHLAFFIEVAVTDKKSGETIVPVFWNDNYVSLLPGETKVLTAKIHKKRLSNKETAFRVKGWNVK
ncbi:MAG: hypothetical protein JEZ14_02245 [Marinilabiliaceae bacterium]|nr:hypothetical protein [Marinilabiliaceae bacterium]